MYQPLADRIRPQKIEEVFGQKHILAEGRPLFNLIRAKRIKNMIFYGPSGTGKTTVANIIAEETQRKLCRINATTASTADIRDVIGQLDTLMAPEGILLYIDEIQYFNKKQQQSILEVIENGKVTLIASTTENPYFYIYNAILSRSTVFEFKPLEPEDIKQAVLRGFELAGEERATPFKLEDGVLDTISRGCGGDVRKALNAVEVLCDSSLNGEITLDFAKQVSQKSAMRYDRDGDMHYDILSCFQKSIRGSDPDAAVFYLARLLEAGDLTSICRRLLVCAAEDIGLAWPQGIILAKACVDSALQLGLPEGRIPLAQAVLALATAPKSNSAIVAVDEASSDIREGKVGTIPAHLQDGHYAGAKKLGRSIGYKYPHSFPNAYVEQQYLPDELKDRKYYKYGDNKTEQTAKQYWDKIKGTEEK